MSFPLIPIANADLSPSYGANFLVDRLGKVLRNHLAPPLAIQDSALPLYGLTWTRAVINHVGSGSLNNLRQKLRNCSFSRSEYDRLAAFRHQDFAIDTAYLPEWGGMAHTL